MTPKQFNDAVVKLYGSVYACADPLGISLRQAQRYASGETTPVAPPVAALIGLLLENVAALKADRKRLIDQLAFFDRPNAAIGANGENFTQGWKTTLRDRLREIESLLREHPSGLIPQI